MIALWGVIAIVGGQVHPVDGDVIEGGVVIVEGDRIRAVGAGLAVPAGATVIDARGKVVTPGLIDGWTSLGLVEVGLEPATNDIYPSPGRAIRAGRRAADAFNPYSAVLPIQRAHGVTTVLSVPEGGLVAGQGAVFDLGPAAPVRAVAAMRLDLGAQAEGGRDEALAAFRELVADARLYAKGRGAFDRGQFRRSDAHRLDLEAMVPVVEGKVPLAVRVQRAADIEAALRMAAALKLRVVLIDAVEAWRVADAIAAARIPVFVQPWITAPLDFDRLHVREDAAVILAKAGVSVAISTMHGHNVRKLRQWAGNAVRAGLPHAVALRAVTRAPAEAWGLPDRGHLKPGAVANVVVWSGDPFELSTRAEAVLVQGRVADLAHRQQQLFERYRGTEALR